MHFSKQLSEEKQKEKKGDEDDLDLMDSDDEEMEVEDGKIDHNMYRWMGDTEGSGP